jgi:prepilin-type N-terminal cleavage/methylation domain-containing protein
MLLNNSQKNKGFTPTPTFKSRGKLVWGFTLIELMIATSLFTVIMLMGVGSLVVSSNSSKASQKLRITVDNVNFAMESMTRELRMGTAYECGTTSVNLAAPMPTDCPLGTPGYIIAFNPQQIQGVLQARVSYQLFSRTDGSGTHSLQRCEKDVLPCSEIVSPDVDVQTLKFFVKGSKFDDNIQPSVEILIKGVVNIKNKNMSKSFTLQTMASQRSAEK